MYKLITITKFKSIQPHTNDKQFLNVIQCTFSQFCKLLYLADDARNHNAR